MTTSVERMNRDVYPAVVAAIIGIAVAFVLLAPFVAIQVRRRGSLTAGNALLGLSISVYAVALASYTLLPLPSDAAALCAGGGAVAQLRPGQFVLDIVRGGSPIGLEDLAVQQIAFNVLLFVPLGMFVRHLLHRRILTTALAGLVISLLIELTQLTGDWGLYPCAYRLFDVDDLLANTAGALLGALLAPLLRLVPRSDGHVAQEPRAITSRRRLLGMLCDWAGALALSLALAFGWVTVQLLSDPSARVRTAAEVAVRLTTPLLVLAMLLRTGRTPGEAAVRLRPVGRRSPGAALVRWLLGIGGFLLLQASERTAALGYLLAVVSVVAVLVTDGRRGLAYRVVGWRLQDDRAAAVPAAGDPT